VPPPSISTGIETDTVSAALAENGNIHSVTSIRTPARMERVAFFKINSLSYNCYSEKYFYEV
jgi:hypothetical protein